MANYQLTSRADSDLISIFKYSIRNFGEQQADYYLEELNKTFQFLADNPRLGINHRYLKKGIRSHLHANHLIYFKHISDGIKILRILHGSMKPPQNL